MASTKQELKSVKPGSILRWTCPGYDRDIQYDLIVERIDFLENIAKIILSDGDVLKAYPRELDIIG